MPAMRATTAAVAVAMRVRLPVIRVAVGAAGAVAMQTRQDTRDEEKHAVHNPKRKGGLEHGARLVEIRVPGGKRRAAERPEADIVGVAARDARAVGAGDHAQRVHGADEGADEEQVDDRDELRVRGRAVVAEERVDGPGEGDDGDDEEHQDVVWCELV